MRNLLIGSTLWAVVLVAVAIALQGEAPKPAPAADDPIDLLDAPLLFVKRQAYMSAHIYDDYLEWHPGGGIYVIENPKDPPEKQRVRAVIDPTTPETLGEGVYRDPELSYDAKKLLFAFKGSRDGDTAIFEIGIDGKGLRRLTDPGKTCTKPPPVGALGKGRHDINPCYLPDGRIVFTSTRQGNRVPCFNSEVDTMHVMNADGSGVRALSVNNVTDFDPVVMPDGRILFGRWEYVDKTALYIQSLWTMWPDGTNETAVFKNNLCKPTAVLDARAVPGSNLIVASLTPHNGQSVGAIAMIDPEVGKNDLAAITNLTPDFPTEMDQGLKFGPSDPWPLNRDAVLIANNAKGPAVIELIERSGRRRLIHQEEGIGCYSPMLIKPREVPPNLAMARSEGPGTFFVHNVAQGLGLAPGEVARLRIIEETARTSGIPAGGRWWNQAFLTSWQGSYTVKNILGMVPVNPDGSVYFEAPAGKALYFQALDKDGRMLQSMRTFVQAVPGVTRSCVGCHEYKHGAPMSPSAAAALTRGPMAPQDESWGSGYIDYPTQVQPILDRHCVSCHGQKDIAGGIDLSGGWTWAFSISYETILKNTLGGFLNCENSRVRTAEILPARAHGSGSAPLAGLLLEGHKGMIPKLSAKERDLLLAWMDGNCNYYGTWDWAEHATNQAILTAGVQLAGVMRSAGCVKCHEPQVGNDWINLQDPKLSRILRAPLAKSADGGLEWCREAKAAKAFPLVDQRVQPPDVFTPRPYAAPKRDGAAVVSFTDAKDATYQAMLAILQQARREALAKPRRDMPGAMVYPGEIRQLVAPALPARALAIEGTVRRDGAVRLNWERSARTIGLEFEVHRADRADFAPEAKTVVARTPGFEFVDADSPAGAWHYALVPLSDTHRGVVSRVKIDVPKSAPPPAPAQLEASPLPGSVRLSWDADFELSPQFVIYRNNGDGWEKLTQKPIGGSAFIDAGMAMEAKHRYRVCAVDRRGIQGAAAESGAVTPLALRKEPVFIATFAEKLAGTLDRGEMAAKKQGEAKIEERSLRLGKGGYLAFAHQPAFDIGRQFSIECRVLLEDGGGSMPVILSCGQWQGDGWFLQRIGQGFRFHLGGVDCDGGRGATGKWTHLIASFDGTHARLYQDGKMVAEVPAAPSRGAWNGPLLIGNYSAQPGPQYQVVGRVSEVRVYERAVKP